MSLAHAQNRLQLPETLRAQLHDFRRRVWSIKMIEAGGAAIFGVAAAFLATFALDRAWDTPAGLRAGLLVAAGLGCAIVPAAIHRWIWRNRRLEQLARLLSHTHPRVGDQLLGVIELVRSDTEQARSRALCEAAIEQVARDARQRDFRDAVPHPRHRLWVGLAAVPLAVALGLFALVPAAATNAWARFLAPWQETPRYTFAAVEPLPSRLVVAHGEPFAITARLAGRTAWRPDRGAVRLGDQSPVSARLRDGRFHFELPAQIEPGWLSVRIGDWRQWVRIEPTLRPELTAVVADVALPGYLGRPRPEHKDVRGGSIALVKGSQARFAATASRELSSAEVDGRPQPPAGATVSSTPTRVEGSRTMEFRWRDRFGLAGKEPFTLSITGRDDEAPTLASESLPRQKVVLDSELISFKVRARDDFGVRRIGLEWRGFDDPAVKTPARGERILTAGGTDKEAMEIGGTFSARALGIEPQPIHVRLFVEDYFPGRARVYSPASTFYVLNAQQHAIWLTEQLSKWHRQSLEVRDRELQLYETNKQLRDLSRDELDRPETRRRIENQAMAERANGRRLSSLVGSGEDLVRQATRNPEFGVGHLEKWAEMLQVLKDIAANRMPSVADLLRQASQAPIVAANSPSNKTPMAGQVRDARSGASRSPGQKKAASSTVPQVVDRESSQQPLDKTSKQEASSNGQSNAQPRLGLPQTTLAGTGGSGGASCPSGQKIEEAVTKQRDLLAEFEKIADELNRVLAHLEGSTLVKRLKAASRLQYTIAGRIADQLSDTFGLLTSRFRPTPAQVLGLSPTPAQVLGEIADREANASHDVSLIMDDMHSYFERRRFLRFRTVLDEMKKHDVVGSLRQLGDDLKKESGVSIAQCEYWSDTLDRWADDLVDPTSGGT
jgi:hypothetical protein